MDVAIQTRSTYAAAWAILLGSLLVLAAGVVWGVIEHARVDALLGVWIGFMALQVAVFLALVAIEYRTQRAYWSMSIPFTIVIARVVAGLTAILVAAILVTDEREAAYADVLF